jgi:hypothetical protein
MDMTSNHQISLGGALGIAVAALLSVLLSACAAGPQCTELGDCGGNPVGSWSSNDAAHPGCLDGPYFTPTTVTAAGAAFDSTLYGRPAPVAGQSPAQPTLADWCEGLVLQKDRTNILGGRVTFVFEDPAITKFSVVYNSDLTYTSGFVRSGRFAQYYSQTCLTEFGQDPNDCAAIQATVQMEDLTGQWASSMCTPVASGGCDCSYGAGAHLSGQALTCKVSEIIMNREGTNETFKNVACTPDVSRGGCNCGYDAAFANGDIGVYTVSGNVITNHPQNSADYPSKITFCQQNDSLQISGFQSSYLYNKAPVRTFRLNRDSNAAPPVMMEMGGAGGAPPVAAGGTGGDSAGTAGAPPAMGSAGMGTAGTATAGMGGM